MAWYLVNILLTCVFCNEIVLCMQYTYKLARNMNLSSYNITEKIYMHFWKKCNIPTAALAREWKRAEGFNGWRLTQNLVYIMYTHLYPSLSRFLLHISLSFAGKAFWLFISLSNSLLRFYSLSPSRTLAYTYVMGTAIPRTEFHWRFVSSHPYQTRLINDIIIMLQFSFFHNTHNTQLYHHNFSTSQPILCCSKY